MCSAHTKTFWIALQSYNNRCVIPMKKNRARARPLKGENFTCSREKILRKLILNNPGEISKWLRTVVDRSASARLRCDQSDGAQRLRPGSCELLCPARVAATSLCRNQQTHLAGDVAYPAFDWRNADLCCRGSRKAGGISYCIVWCDGFCY